MVSEKIKGNCSVALFHPCHQQPENGAFRECLGHVWSSLKLAALSGLAPGHAELRAGTFVKL